MQIRKAIDRTYSTRGKKNGSSVAGGINAAVAANVGEEASTNSVSSQSRVSIVQSGGEPTPPNRKAK